MKGTLTLTLEMTVKDGCLTATCRVKTPKGTGNNQLDVVSFAESQSEIESAAASIITSTLSEAGIMSDAKSIPF